MTAEPRLVEVRKNVLKQNDVNARALRGQFRAAGVFVVSLVSSPGSGKTAFLEKTLTLLHQRASVAALVGDLATENDAVRLARSQAPVKQITTGTICHLEAAMIQNALAAADWHLPTLDFLFIENVGNLVCPSSYDLGENLRLVLLSVTEGEDKPLKYPGIFRKAQLMVLNKVDLLPYVPFDPKLALENARRIHSDIEIIETSCTTEVGLYQWLAWLNSRIEIKKAQEVGHAVV